MRRLIQRLKQSPQLDEDDDGDDEDADDDDGDDMVMMKWRLLHKHVTFKSVKNTAKRCPDNCKEKHHASAAV